MNSFEAIEDLLAFAIRKEREAADFYVELAGSVREQGMAEVFHELAAEERQHEALLQAVKVGDLELSAAGNVPDLKIADYMVKTRPEPGMSYQDALILAMHREKASFRLYSNLAAVTNNATVRQMLLGMAQEEAKHKLKLEVQYDQVILTEN